MSTSAAASPTRIIGIDPGSRQAGCAILEICGSCYNLLSYATLYIKGDRFSQRLTDLHQQVAAIIQRFQPTEAAIEQVFVNINPQSALKLGQARGVLLLALAQQQIPIAEYAPRLVKQACSGYGAASKDQIQSMIQRLFKLPKKPPADAADACAIALCHANQRNWQQRLAQHASAASLPASKDLWI